MSESSIASIVSVGSGLIAMIGTAIAAWTNRLREKDKLQFNNEMTQLKLRAENCEKSHKNCDERADKLEAKSDEYARLYRETASDLQKIKDKLQVE